MKEWFILVFVVFNTVMLVSLSGQVLMLKEKLFGLSRRPSRAETEEWEQRLLSLRESPPKVVKCEQPANPIGAVPLRYGSIPPKRGY